MRVITGSARGRRLKELEGMETRPTTDRVKEGLFSAIQFDIEGRKVLDLFAGTGQLGIECLSRGAASAVFVRVVLYNHGPEPQTIFDGDRVAQLLVVPVLSPEMELVDRLDETQRGAGGFGSTGEH